MKAVIPAAGLGSRFLPATKAQPKEMLPVVDKPAIQYIVEEASRRESTRSSSSTVVTRSPSKTSSPRTMCSLSTYAVWARTHMPMPSSMRARFP